MRADLKAQCVTAGDTSNDTSERDSAVAEIVAAFVALKGLRRNTPLAVIDAVNDIDASRQESAATPVIAAYFQSHDAVHFADNAEWLDMAQSSAAHGRAEIAEVIRQWYVYDVGNPRDEPRNLIANEDTVVVEWIYHAWRRRDRNVRVAVPIAAIFEVSGRAIVRVRRYLRCRQAQRGVGRERT